MAGRGRRKSGGKGDQGNRTQRVKANRIMNNVFLDTGFPSSLSSSPEINMIGNSQSLSRYGNNRSISAKVSSSSKSATRKLNRNFFGYAYPDVESQDTGNHAYADDVAFGETQNVAFDYGFGSSFVLGESSYKGLGFCDDSDASHEGKCLNSPTKQEEISCISAENKHASTGRHAHTASNQIKPIKFDLCEESESRKVHSKKNSAFVSIGGVKVFTQDMSDGENGLQNGPQIDSSSSNDSASSKEDQCTDSAISDSEFGSNSEIDEDILEDYLEGIGGADNLFNAKWLLENDLHDSEGDTTSSDSFDETVQRLGGIALQEASREYGMHTPLSRKLNSMFLGLDGSVPLTGKRHGKHMPRSWPTEAGRYKSSRSFPGSKKKHRKEMISGKRRERMLNRGVDIKKINAKMEEIVWNKLDVFSFEPMHSRDCSQLRRLAAIYRLQSGCQGSGKKRFVTVTRTQYTSMPSTSDKIRLIKLLGSEDDDGAVNDPSKPKSANANGKHGLLRRGGRSTSESHSRRKVAGRTVSRQKGSSIRNRGVMDTLIEKGPVLFVSSGTMESENVQVTKNESPESRIKVAAASAEIGAFELHTRGFGSKMMTKMGYVEGGGLGKAGQGMAEPIGVLQRPKSLGLGFDLSSSVDSLLERKPRNENVAKQPEFQNIGSFEKHTKGFGSKIMGQMGFVQGMGLGRNSQGIITPVAAVRRPKARGLGA